MCSQLFFGQRHYYQLANWRIRRSSQVDERQNTAGRRRRRSRHDAAAPRSSAQRRSRLGLDDLGRPRRAGARCTRVRRRHGVPRVVSSRRAASLIGNRHNVDRAGAGEPQHVGPLTIGTAAHVMERDGRRLHSRAATGRASAHVRRVEARTQCAATTSRYVSAAVSAALTARPAFLSPTRVTAEESDKPRLIEVFAPARIEPIIRPNRLSEIPGVHQDISREIRHQADRIKPRSRAVTNARYVDHTLEEVPHRVECSLNPFQRQIPTDARSLPTPVRLQPQWSQ